MIFLILKLLLVLVLTMIPILFGMYVKPKQDSSEKCRNLYAFIGSYMPAIKRRYVCVKIKMQNLWQKMTHTRNGRKFFTCIVILFLLTLQFVDLRASGEVAEACMKEQVSKSRMKPLINQKTTAMVTSGHDNTYHSRSYSYMTAPFAYVLSMFITLALFCDKLTVIIFNAIAHNPYVTCAMIILIWFLSIYDVGRYMLLSQIFEVILFAGVIYPRYRKIINPNGGTCVEIDKKEMMKKAA